MRAVALNVGVFVADNNLRRSVGAFTGHYRSDKNYFNQLDIGLDPGGEREFVIPEGFVNTLLFLRSSGPVELEVDLDGVDSYTVTMQEMHLIDFPFVKLTMKNNGSDEVSVYLINTASKDES